MLGLQLTRDGYRIAAMTLHGRIIEQSDGPVEAEGLVDTLVAAVRRWPGILGRTVLAVGVAVPGVVDPEGLISRAVSMHWDGLRPRRPAGRARWATRST